MASSGGDVEAFWDVIGWSGRTRTGTTLSHSVGFVCVDVGATAELFEYSGVDRRGTR